MQECYEKYNIILTHFVKHVMTHDSDWIDRCVRQENFIKKVAVETVALALKLLHVVTKG
jgi:hypothetical protein